ncbi:enoyl-CoA hydratase-related protein [Phyllobacterium brassicacearum]|uniref:enoyl-CoA hydratase-related protein n=1 Tax=Phyllobacterium brassicacearum TaxID=314235 RepID=UPI0010D6A5A0|nr:enoyl-CoA hydratase-related protein [Phyllobacterium brassicacearum]TDQ18030.1 enoyl-CoA hydratase/isomerase-like protein [Phyllobacterium brassicacearum]
MTIPLGGGIGLASICDIAVAASDCRFGFTEIRLGIIPAKISPYVVARMGEGMVRRVFMSARIFSADEAVTLNIIAKSVDARRARRRDRGGSFPLSFAAAGRSRPSQTSCSVARPPINDKVINDTIRQLADTWEAEEASEEIAAFLEKRKPRWVS